MTERCISEIATAYNSFRRYYDAAKTLVKADWSSAMKNVKITCRLEELIIMAEKYQSC
ncbi:MAG: hypothetical protein MZV63_03120 [Marinilabiliales bacterium]|nr:hypothetical protein [Marinilabiliales bacterium]